MAYVDEEEDLPAIFRRHGVFPLPTKRGTYVLVRGRGFHSLEPAPPAEEFSSRLAHSLVTMEGSHSEAARLSYAYNSGLLDHFLGTAGLRPIALGRAGTQPFHFFVDGGRTRVEVDKAQIEIDGAYENDRLVVLVEANTAPCSSFIHRQVYYPYRRWLDVAARHGKEVRNLFIVFGPDAGTCTIWEYRWRDPLDYEAIELVRCASYCIVEWPLAPEDFAHVRPREMGDFEVPQANDVGKILMLPLLVAQGIDDSASVAEAFGFDPRQSSYYRRAAEALRLLAQDPKTYRYVLTPKGREFVELPAHQRFERLAVYLLELPIMNEVFRQALVNRERGVGPEEMANIIRTLSHVSGSTPGRRASTILAWFRWMGDTLGIVRVEDKRVRVLGNVQQRL